MARWPQLFQLSVCLLLAAGCGGPPWAGQPAGPLRQEFQKFALSVPDRGVCLPSLTNGTDVRLTFRPPDPELLKQEVRPVVPPLKHLPCPRARNGIDVRVRHVNGAVAAVGPGNLLQDNEDGPPMRLQEAHLNSAEAAILGPFFGSGIIRALSGRDPRSSTDAAGGVAEPPFDTPQRS